MLTLKIKGKEAFNPSTNKFIQIKDATIVLEHSLVSISKWESKYHVPFISTKEKTQEQLNYYVKCMTITQNVDDNVYTCLTQEQYKLIDSYISDPMTATWFNEPKGAKKSSRNSEQITSELIYYWMVALQIPFECKTWHLNRLLTLIRICNIKNQPPKKYSKRDIMSKNAALNAARKKNLGTSG